MSYLNQPPSYDSQTAMNGYYHASVPSAPLAPELQLSKSEKIQNLISSYEIDPLFSEKLCILEQYDIVCIIDDSGSMNTPLNDGTHTTRWDELKSVVNIVIRISTIFDDDGIDIHFLNRNCYKKIKSFEQISHILNNKPSGLTPLNNKLSEVLEEYDNSSKPVLIVIATDGVPTNVFGHPDLDNFKQTLINKDHSKFYVSFLACSDQEADIGYLNKLDKKIPNIDTLDDYQSELKEVLHAQGKKFKYTFGDHVTRLLLGPICSELDKLDEKRHKKICAIL